MKLKKNNFVRDKSTYKIFLTGASGYLGAYILRDLLQDYRKNVIVLVRDVNINSAIEKIKLKMRFFYDESTVDYFFKKRITVVLGDLEKTNFGLSKKNYKNLIHSVISTIHCAAVLNRKSEMKNLRSNVKGIVEIIKFSQIVNQLHNLYRLSFVSSVAITSERQGMDLNESQIMDWSLRKTDPYGRSKLLSEYLLKKLFIDSKKLIIFRPSFIICDSLGKEMLSQNIFKIMIFFSFLPIWPVGKKNRIDMIPVDFVSKCIVKIHFKKKIKNNEFNISSGKKSITILNLKRIVMKKFFFPICISLLSKPFYMFLLLITKLPKKIQFVKNAYLLSVFWPFLNCNTVYTNDNLTKELDIEPPKIEKYLIKLFKK